MSESERRRSRWRWRPTSHTRFCLFVVFLSFVAMCASHHTPRHKTIIPQLYTHTLSHPFSPPPSLRLSSTHSPLTTRTHTHPHTHTYTHTGSLTSPYCIYKTRRRTHTNPCFVGGRQLQQLLHPPICFWSFTSSFAAAIACHGLRREERGARRRQAQRKRKEARHVNTHTHTQRKKLLSVKAQSHPSLPP